MLSGSAKRQLGSKPGVCVYMFVCMYSILASVIGVSKEALGVETCYVCMYVCVYVCMYSILASITRVSEETVRVETCHVCTCV